MNKIEKLQEFTMEVRKVLDSLYRVGSAERAKIAESDVVNTLAILEVSEKLDKVIELLSVDKKVEEPKKVEASKTTTAKTTK